jgi:hypothetical protein
MAQHKFFNINPPAMGVLLMDKTLKTKFKELLKDLLRFHGSKTGLRNENIANLLGLKYSRLVRFKTTNNPEFPNLKELKDIEEFFKIDLKEYYPTDCEITQAYILKRLENKIKLTDMTKLLGYYIDHRDLMAIETNSFEQLTEKQKKIYTKFMDLVV